MATTTQLALRPDALKVGDPYKAVSSRSVWNDAVWRLDGAWLGSGTRTTSIYWPTEIDEELLEAFRRLFWSTYVVPQEQPPPSALTLAQYNSGMRVLARWMDEEAYGFEHVDVDFGRHLREHLGDLVGDVDGDDYSDDEDGGDLDEDAASRTSPVSFGLVNGALRMVALIHSQRHALRSMGMSVPDEDPLEGQSPHTLAFEIRAPAPGRRGALPNEVSMPLMMATDRLVAGGAFRDVALLQERCLAAIEGVTGRGGWASARRTRALAEATTDIEFSTLPGEARSWHGNLRDDGGRKHMSDIVRDLVTFAQTTCVLLLLQLTGMRPGEIVALLGGIDPETGLPSCVERVLSPSGGLWMFYAVGKVKKGRTGPEDARWLVGAVPVGVDALPTSVIAIQTLERLGRPWRDNSSNPIARQSLLVSVAGSRGFLRKASALPMLVERLQQNLLATYPRLMDLGALPDFSSEGIPLRSYKRSSPDGSSLAPLIRTSQWRKTYATMLVLIDGRLASALTRHFQHLHAATLDGAYVSSDGRLLEILDSARMATVMDMLSVQIDGRLPSIGRAGRILERNAVRIRRLIDDARAMPGGVSGLLEVHAPTAWRGEHADCAFFVAPHRAACHENAGTAHFLNERPDFELRTPETCVGCANAQIGPSHLAFWRDRYLEANRARRTMEGHAAALAMRERARLAAGVFTALRRRMSSKEIPERK